MELHLEEAKAYLNSEAMPYTTMFWCEITAKALDILVNGLQKPEDESEQSIEVGDVVCGCKEEVGEIGRVDSILGCECRISVYNKPYFITRNKDELHLIAKGKVR